jgi:hypothetical protein
MASNPGSTSGTYNFANQWSTGDTVLEALSRCQIRGTAIDQHHMADAWRSINLSLQALNNRSINLFQVEQFVIELVTGQATYPVPPEVISLADVYYNIINSIGPGPDWSTPAYDPSQPIVTNDPQIIITQSQDRWLRPLGRADYARIPNKTIPGTPTSYWFNRIGPPNPTTVTFWPVPQQGYPNFAATCFALRSAQDAGLAGGELPDVVNRFLDWLCADVALRLARKYQPTLIGQPGSGGLLDDANEAWRWAETEDTEKAEISVRPDIYLYFRM